MRRCGAGMGTALDQTETAVATQGVAETSARVVEGTVTAMDPAREVDRRSPMDYGTRYEAGRRSWTELRRRRGNKAWRLHRIIQVAAPDSVYQDNNTANRMPTAVSSPHRYLPPCSFVACSSPFTVRHLPAGGGSHTPFIKVVVDR